MTDNIAEMAEAELRALAAALTEPDDRECLRCFVVRMLGEFGCDGTHRWTIRWRDVRAPLATGLLRRLGELGGSCDCEVIMNVFPPYPRAARRLPCAGQPRPGSAVPCHLRAARPPARR
jgi:hypothetical protein